MSEVINENVINTEVEAKTVETVETVETVQTVAVETVEDATGNMEVATGTSAGVVDVKDLVDNREYKKIAEYFSTLTGSSEEARKMLQMVLNTLPAPVGSVMNPRKRPAPSASSSSVATTPSVTDVDAFLIQDSMDAGVVSALIQIPNDPAVIGSIIGPRGSTIKQITDTTGCVVNLDQKSNAAKNRIVPITVFLQGPLRSVVKAAELVSQKLEALITEWSGIAPWSGTGSGLNRTIIVIPDPLVRRVIGKQGTQVSKLQQDTGVEIQLQNEAKMRAAPDPLFGREALLTGSLQGRLHALYLISRMLLDDKDCPPNWRTSNMFPTPLRSGGMMTTKGAFASAAPPPHHQQPGNNPYGYNPQPGAPLYGTSQQIGARLPVPPQVAGAGAGVGAGVPGYGLTQQNVHPSTVGQQGASPAQFNYHQNMHPHQQHPHQYQQHPQQHPQQHAQQHPQHQHPHPQHQQHPQPQQQHQNSQAVHLGGVQGQGQGQQTTGVYVKR